MIKAAVFDLDHTLFDRYATLKAVTPMFREQYGFKDGVTDSDFCEKLCYADKQYVHNGWEQIHSLLVDSDFFVNAPDLDEYTEFLLSCFKKVAVPFPFTLPTLKELKRRGYLLGLITNGRHEVQVEKLSMLGLSDIFDEVIISGDYTFKKPDAEIFSCMAEKLGIAIGEMVYVGDHPKFDVDGSRKAGAVPVWVRTTGTWIFPDIKKPELQIDTVKELPEVLERLK